MKQNNKKDNSIVILYTLFYLILSMILAIPFYMMEYYTLGGLVGLISYVFLLISYMLEENNKAINRVYRLLARVEE